MAANKSESESTRNGNPSEDANENHDNEKSNNVTQKNEKLSVFQILTPQSKKDMAEKEARIRRILWRDFIFLILAFIGARFMSFVELNASRAELRGATATGQVAMSPSTRSWFWSNSCGVIDTGYILTTPLYEFLRDHRRWNDILAAVNSFILFVPGVYTSCVTFWKGDFELAFRYFATHLLRSLCGWFTYLPPDSSYLPSNYDFPDIWQCLLIKDCSQSSKAEALPFVSFFSGHVATMVCTANHMYMHGHRKLGILCHILNVFQIIRFLATRGHYSIDIIIGWYVAVYVSNPAGRLGRYFSKGTKLEDVLPENAKQAFELFTGISDTMAERIYPKLIKKHDLQNALRKILEDQGISDEISVESTSETTVTLLVEELERAALEQKKNIEQKKNQ